LNSGEEKEKERERERERERRKKRKIIGERNRVLFKCDM
jgi:hypothetical protein